MAMTEEQLRERLRKIAALFEGAKTEGERAAAAAAFSRVKEALKTAQPAPPPIWEEPLVEMQFSMPDQWHRRLMSALCRRHGLTPFRYKRQRLTTLMLRVKQSYLDRVLWPE